MRPAAEDEEEKFFCWEKLKSDDFDGRANAEEDLDVAASLSVTLSQAAAVGKQAAETLVCSSPSSQLLCCLQFCCCCFHTLRKEEEIFHRSRGESKIEAMSFKRFGTVCPKPVIL